jgi:ferredoxin
MKIATDRERCIGAGQCVLNAPDVFDQDDEGTVVVLDDHPSPVQEPAVRAAEHACPARVISLVS